MVIENIPGTMIERLQSQEAFGREPPADQNDLLLVRSLASAFQANLTEMAALKDTWDELAPATGLTPAAATLEKTAQVLSRQITGDDSRIVITLVDSVLAQTRQLMATRDSIAGLGLPGFFNGTFLETLDAVATSNGTTVTMTLEQRGGGDLTMRFSDGRTKFDCTPLGTASIELIPGGTDPSPQSNFVYILQSTKALTVSTSDWPIEEHIKVAYFLVPTASLVNTGAPGNNYLYSVHNWNDHSKGTDGQGHLSHVTEQARQRGAKWRDGCLGAATQDGNDLWVSVAAGTVYQMHRHSFAALDSDTAGAGDTILVANDPDAQYTIINSLNSITKHSDGSDIGLNKYVKFVLVCVANKSGEVSPMLLNLPSGHYNTQDDAATDVDGLANFSIPTEFQEESTTGFLNAAFVCKHTATAMEIQQTIDLRGQITATASGSGTGGGDVSAHAALADHAIVRGDGGAKDVQDSTPTIGDDGVMSVPGLGTGGYTDYDLMVGNVTTPDYGMIQIGNASFGRTSFEAGAINLKGAVICRNMGGPVTGEIEFLWAESTGDTCRLAIPQSAVGNHTYHPRSLTIGPGPAPADTDFVKISYWQALGWFHNLLCDTSTHGADLGVENDLEVEGKIWVDEIEESTPAADLKLQPGAGGGVVLFGDTDVGDAVAGRSLYVHRRAAEGDFHLQFFVSAAKEATISANSYLVIKTTSQWIVFSSPNDIFADLGDNAGANKLAVRDSDFAEVATIDSDGTGTFVTVDTPQLANTGGNLKIEPDAEGDVTFFEDTDVADAAAGKSVYIYRKAVEGDTSLRLYVSNDQEAILDSTSDLVLISGVGKVLWLLSGDDVILGLGDDAGADKVEVQDVNLNVVATIDSDGTGTFVTVDTPQLANTGGDLKIEPDAEGDVYLFGDTDVGDEAAGKSLYLYRKAVEGDAYLRLAINQDKLATIYLSTDFLIQAAGGYIRLLSNDDITLDLGDNAGAKKLRLRDSDFAEVGAWDSDGNITLDGTVDGRDVAADGAILDTLGTIATENTPLVINKGGSGQVTQQAAIDALTNVSGATNEHVLTKDTATGNAVFKVAAGGNGGGYARSLMLMGG